ncbi:4-(cytidine 5'-diphospho)-2-C-methyl-D-erythritol kinase [Nocardioides nematodiphilus]|uniref:4-(cytidine 5'-diphospho)-2-C-methyl-D-erythritol kinase n=1 Tax=Nocardioides nematodiphilus TaxID=2849669 RepID=UPI001CD9DFC5|nr:4-(cytidine 5'-diphospho)-2-C-methyl-D-erythritol kinase [Nocardioides nematodiphilus]MCA1983159.1 4-(cytidine 5'-diphospho)-2-C-methyl-D-erythritol kinase [Nocardioides nematodiphilus]
MSAPVSVTVRAAAKINLHLGVGAVRDDGFHPLATVYQAIGLYEDVTATRADTWSIHTIADAGIDPDGVPDDETNIAIRAGRALAEHHGLTGHAAHLEVHKGIPVAGGLAGGSADAAAALVALDRLWGLETSDDDLLAIAADLGSDVPFALLGGTAIGTGRGELVEPLENNADLWWLVVPSDIGLSTPQVYRKYDDLAPADAAGDAHPAELVAALASGDAGAVIGALRNDLTAPAYALRHDLAARVGELTGLLGSGIRVLLSGSGPTQLVPYADLERARLAAARLTEAGIAHWLAPAPVAGVHVVHYD